MNRYLALTVGPIFSTLTQVRSTKALWSASYMFSWLMREILKVLRENPGLELLNLPNKQALFTGQHGVGLFSDRLTIQLKEDTEVDLAGIVETVVDNLALKMRDDLNKKDLQRADEQGNKHIPNPLYTKDEILLFLKQYLRLLSVEFELLESDHNPVKTADDFLNSLELQATFVQQQDSDFLSAFFEDLFFNFFIREEFGEDAGFPSTLEISTGSFVLHNKDSYEGNVKTLRKFERGIDTIEAQRKQEDFVRAVRNLGGKRFKLCHKYIAIVRADGDNVGHLFKTLLEQDGLNAQIDVLGSSRAQQLADALAEFSLAATKAIKAFGGTPVYAGGDDLLFFAPVSVETLFIKDWNRQNIFDLLDTLDILFKQYIMESEVVKAVAEKLGSKNPSMSYGLSMSYYKYPLTESLQIADKALFGSIKADNNRNGIAWRTSKHSGSGFGRVSKKTDKSHEIFRDLLKTPLSGEETKDAFLASVMYKIESLEGLFRATAHKPAEHFENIIFNNFNESVHRDGNELSPFLKKVVALLVSCFQENPVDADANVNEKAVKENLERAYAALRFIHFLETEDKD